MKLDFSNKVVFITGGAKGIGAATARILANAGATVAVNYLSSEQAAQALAEEVNQLHNRKAISLHKADVTDELQVASIVRDIVQKYGKIDGLVNNAGIRNDGFTHSTKSEQWLKTIDINLNAHFYTTRDVLAYMMKAKSGSIVFVSSIAGSTGSWGQSSYAATKAALQGFAKSVALEYGPRNVRANVVVPGIIHTDMSAHLKEKYHDKFSDMTALKRFGTPEEVAYVIAFLLSDYSSYVTGACWHINGGMVPL